MKFEEYDLNEYDYIEIVIPETGEVIMDNEGAKTGNCLACWSSELIDDPEIYDKDLQKAWDEFCQELKKDNYKGDINELDPRELRKMLLDGKIILKDVEVEDVVNFLKNYDAPQWKVLELYSSGIAGGVIFTTTWAVVPASTILREAEIED